MDYYFHEGEIPAGFKLTFEESLFNSEVHRLLQAPDRWTSFSMLHSEAKEVVAALHFHIHEGWARSPYRSPYGSIEFNSKVDIDAVSEFMVFVEDRLRENGVSRITIKHYPQIYQEVNSLDIQSFFQDNRYKVIASEVASVIEVTAENASAGFHRSAKRKLKNAGAAGCVFERLPIEELKMVFNFIQKCRTEKNYSLSMTFDALQKTATFSSRFYLFGVFKDGTLIAAAITIHVKSDVLYDFYHDHNSTFDSLSPVVMLVSGIYDFCRREKIIHLDLGTSSIQDQPNVSLQHFKALLGGKSSPKLTFEKLL